MDDYNWADVKNTSNTTDQDMEMDEDENDQAIKENKGQLTREEEESSLATPIRGAAEGNLPAGRPGWGRLRNLLQDARRDSPSSQNPSEKGPARAERPIERSFEAVRNLNRNREKQLTRHDSKPRNNSRQNFVDSRNKSHKSPRRNSNPHRQTNGYPAQQGQKPTQYAPRGPPNNARAMRGFEEEVQPQMTEAACPNSSNQRFSKLVAQNILSTEKTPPETPKQLHLPPISINLPFDSFLQENDNMTTCAPAFLEDYALLCNMASPKMTVTLLPDLDNLDRNDHLLIDLSSLFKGSLPTPLCGDCVDATLSWNDTRNVRLPFSTCAPQGVDRKLTSLLVPQSCIEDVTNIIDSYRTHDLRFHYLHDLFNKNHLSDKLQAHYLENVIPGMVKLALRLTDLFKKPIPRLLHGTAGSVTMSQEQAACLLANAFFCTFPEPPFDLRWRKTYFNFERMYIIGRRCKIEKIKCLFHYFDAVLQNMPDGLITIRQHHLEEHVEDQFLTMDWKLCDLEVHEKGRIEDTEDKMIEIDFANQYIGGGVLNAGCVQEEIRFVLSPELLVSMLICERMDDRTAISIIGSWRFNDYTGYGDDFKFARRDFPRVSERDKFKRCLSEVMAINAMKFGQKPEYQFEERPIYRELVKAYCAFAHHDDLNRPIATGNWGCGVYRGNKQMKSLIQLIAASAHRRTKMVYFTFDDVDLSNRLRNLHLKLTGNGVSIERLLRMVLSFKEFSETDKDTDLFTYIDSQLDVLIDRK